MVRREVVRDGGREKKGLKRGAKEGRVDGM